jgi:hypothetical protein
MRYLRAELLLRLGRGAEALPIAQSMAAAFSAEPDLGPNHPNTLASRHQVAQILSLAAMTIRALINPDRDR